MKRFTTVLLLLSLFVMTACGNSQAVTTETVKASGEDYFLYGEYETQVSFETVLADLTEKGYAITVTDQTPDLDDGITGNLYYVTVDGMAESYYGSKHYASINVFTDALNASTSLLNLYKNGQTSGWESMVRVGNVTVNGKGGVFRSVMEMFGIKDLPTQRTVSEKTLLTKKVSLAADYTAKLEGAGYTLYQASTPSHDTVAERLFAIAADGSYGFNLYKLQGKQDADDFFDACYYTLTSPQYVYSRCTLDGTTYILYAPLDTVDTLIALISK